MRIELMTAYMNLIYNFKFQFTIYPVMRIELMTAYMNLIYNFNLSCYEN